MGICETKKNTVPSPQNFNINNNNLDSAMLRDKGKYFENKEINNQNSLVLNNDVIVSENSDIEATYQKIKKLGEGAFGEVWLVQNKLLGKLFAMKIIEKSPYSNIDGIKNEIKILKQLDHPNILKILQFHLTSDKFYIITDYCPEGELFNEIDKKNIFSERETSFIIYQILRAIR